MSQSIAGVTLRNLPDMVRRFHIDMNEEFTIVRETQAEKRARALASIREISAKASALAQADGIVTDEDVEKFLEG